MLNIISASKSPEKAANARKMWSWCLAGQTPYRLHIIEGAPSICEAYREGEKLIGKDEPIIYCHDDILALSQNFWPRLKNHLIQVEVLGACGANSLVDGKWFTAGPPNIFGQVLNWMPGGKGKRMNPETQVEEEVTVPPHLSLAVFGVYKRLQKNICCADGFFLAAQQKGILKWDAMTYKDWHFYDVDATYDAYVRGHSLGIASDLHLLHYSSGGYGTPGWAKENPKFLAKWQQYLPPQPHQPTAFNTCGIILPDTHMSVQIMEKLCVNCD